MKLQGGETVNLTEFLYVPQAVKSILSVTMIVSKEATMRATKDKMTTKKGGSSTNLDSRKGRNKSTMFYLNTRIYPPEGFLPQ